MVLLIVGFMTGNGPGSAFVLLQFWAEPTSWLFLRSPRRAGAVRPSPSSHGRHGRRLLRRVRRAAVAGHRCSVPWLADSAGRGHRASDPAASLLVVSRSWHVDLVVADSHPHHTLPISHETAQNVGFVFLSCASLFPESPRWLLATDQIPLAKISLQEFATRNGVCRQDEMYPGETLMSGTNTH